MDNSSYYNPGGHPQQTANPPNMEGNFGPRGPYYPGPSPGFPPAPYQQPQSSAPNVNVDNSSGPNYWAAPNVYQPPQPPNVPPWPPFPPPLSGQGNLGYGYPPPQYQPPPGFDGPHRPPNPAAFEFDPSRPPPGFREPESNQLSTFIEAQRNACSVPQQAEFQSHNDGIRNQWGPGPTTGNANLNNRDRSWDNSRNFSSNEFQTTGAPNLRENEMCQRGIRDAFSESRQNQPPEPAPQDEQSRQRKQDEQWLQKFLLNKKTKDVPQRSKTETPNMSHVREDLYGVIKLVSELSLICQTLKLNLENDGAWTESYSKAVGLKKIIQEKLNYLSDQETMTSIKKKLETIRKKRIRTRRRKLEQVEENQKVEERVAERHAAIDKWRMKRIQKVEEKKREQELKKAADSVLSEVRKKQSDAKKMVDILKALEKLRKLRKEAASRKGVFPEKESDEVFEGHLLRLRALISKRTAVYGAEEKALRVMLEGEQEEERKRDLEKRQKKEREKLLQKKQLAEAMLFGDEIPPDHPLHHYQDFYLQAESSLPALVQIRREWDRFLVPAEHPDGSALPQGWVLPEPPADEAWASALEKHISL